jgi:tRNA A-37 threonylcarbamoyl transferase component Bud32
MRDYYEILFQEMFKVDPSLKGLGYLGRNRLKVEYEGEEGVYGLATRWEIESLGRLNSIENTPNILKVYDGDSWCVPLIRSFFPGKMLSKIDIDLSSLALEANNLIERIHNVGVVTRDLKSDNFVYGEMGLCFVDFSEGCLDYMSEFREAKENELKELKRLF